MAWKKGPLPPGTYGWGGVVPDDRPMGLGFFFADFRGDVAVMNEFGKEERIPAKNVKWYDNSLTLPPHD